MAFSGFGSGACAFYDELAANNTRDWWQANRGRYEAEVRAPLEHLLAELEDEFGPSNVFRPNRDTRFSKDKTPYKTNAAAVVPTGGGGAVYLSIGADGFWIGGGGYRMARDQLARYRAAVDDDRTGAELAGVCADLRRRKAEIRSHDAVKTAPRGYPADHPRIELLRLDGIAGMWHHEPAPAWVFTKQAKSRVVDRWRQLAPLNAWVAANVGDSHLPRR